MTDSIVSPQDLSSQLAAQLRGLQGAPPASGGAVVATENSPIVKIFSPAIDAETVRETKGSSLPPNTTAQDLPKEENIKNESVSKVNTFDESDVVSISPTPNPSPLVNNAPEKKEAQPRPVIETPPSLPQKKNPTPAAAIQTSPTITSSSQPKIFDFISVLTKAVEYECSDVYFKADTVPMAKILGVLYPLSTEVLTSYAIERMAMSLMNDKQQVRFGEQQELDMSFALRNIARFRVSIYRQRGSVALVMRRIKTIIPTLESLHLPAVLQTIIMEQRGLVLITGATGSGKTSSLAAMIDYRSANASGHILTIEDPIEFVLPDRQSIVSQREIDVDTLNWENALKTSMRQAPDVILIGEMRDLHSAQIAVNLAETGHLVLSTLHSTNALQTLERFIAMFPREMHDELYLRLSMSLNAIICQRLVKTADGQGRYPALEIMITSPRIKDLIRKADITRIKDAIAESRNVGMVTFDQSMFDLWKQGIITEEEALLNADSPNNLQLLMRGISYSEAQ